ncbi:MAG: 2-dehydropantoate 2-reductase [Candidatus Pacearchaeota archaeon]|jgi:2-dehydropantoate 2-reductase
MKILIIGAGSIGVYLGTLLFSNNHEVILLGRTKLKKLNETILIGENPYNLPPRIYKMPKNKTFDFIFITSKLYDLQKNLQSVIENNLKSNYLISIQNGIVDESLYEPYVKNSKFTSISVFEGFRLIENQLVASYSKAGWKTDNSETGKVVSKLLFDSKINCTIEKDLNLVKAEKTIMNCSVNLLSAIEKKTFYELFSDEKTLNKINKLFDESYNILKKLYTLRSKEVLKKEFYNIASKMKHYSSTYQDAISKRKTEAEFLNGLIVRLGKKMKMPTPENKNILEEFYRIYSDRNK